MANEKLTIEIDGDVDGFKKSLKKTEKGLGKFQSKLKSIAKASVKPFLLIAGGIAAGITAAVNEARKFEEIQTQFEILTGSVSVAKDTIKDLQDFSARTPFQFTGIAKASTQLLGFGFEADQLIPKLQSIGDVASATGRPIEEIGFIFGQVSAAGKLTGERLLQFQERAVPIGAAIAKTLGVAETAVKDLVSAGEVDFKTFEKAFNSLSEEGGFAFEGMIKQSRTLNGLISTVKDNVSLFAAGMGQKLLPAFKLVAEKFLEFVQQMRDSEAGFEVLSSAMSGVFKIAVSLKAAFSNLGGVIGISLAAGMEAATEAIKGNFIKASGAVLKGSQQIGEVLKENNKQLNKDLSDIDDVFSSKQEEKTEKEIQKQKENADRKKEADQEAFDEKLEQFKENSEVFDEAELEAAQLKIETQNEMEIQKKAQDLEREGKHDQAIKLLEDAKNKRDIKNSKDKIKNKKALAKLERDLDVATASASIDLANNTANFLEAVQGKQTRTSFIIGKVAAAGQVLLADSQARAAATAASAAASIAAGPGAPAAFTASMGFYQGLITANTALALGTIAAQTVQGFAKGGLAMGGIPGMDSIPAMLQAKELVAPSQNFEEVIGSVRAKREADAIGGGGIGGGEVSLMVSYDSPEASQIVTVQQVEDTSLGVSQDSFKEAS